MLNKLLKPFFQNRFLPIFTVFFLAFLLRIGFLGSFPIGITHDELNYIMAAKSIFLTGKFIPQTAPAVLPISMNSFNVVIAEIPAFVLAPLIGLSQFSFISSRIVGVVLSSLTVVVIYFLVIKLIKDKTTALISSLVMSVNPWSFLMGRTIFEVNFFVFFFLLGFLVLLSKRNYGIFYSLPLYLLGFFSYTGGQVVFLLFVIISLCYHFLAFGKANAKPYIAYGFLFFAIFACYLFVVLGNQSGLSRGGELYLPTNQSIASKVDSERLLSIPSNLNKFFVNKSTVYIKGFVEKYLDAFSVNTLFINGEFRAAFSLQQHGTFYFIDLPLILLGLSVLFLKDKKVWLTIILFIAISPITSALSTIEYSYSQRSGLMFPFVIILIGVGISYLIKIAKKPLMKRLIITSICIIYIISITNLLHLYFYRFPVYASDGWFLEDRILSRYIDLSTKTNPGRKILVSTFEPKIVFQEYLYYTQNYNNRETINSVNKNLDRGIFTLGNVEFSSSCPNPEKNGLYIYDTLLNCNLSKTPVVRIMRLKDVYTKYSILGDNLCSDYQLGRYISQYAFKDFNFEKLSAEEFCQSWITKTE